MRHRKRTKRFGRNKPERESMLRNLVRGLFISQRIETTTVKAKEARRLAEKLITLGKRDDLHSRRQVYSALNDEDLTTKLFNEIAPLFKKRAGGYTRIMHSRTRKGDNAKLAVLELTEKITVVSKIKPRKEKVAEENPSQAKDKEAVVSPSVEKPKEIMSEKHPSHKKETKTGKIIHPAQKTPTGFVSTLRKFFKGRTK
ncbi:MAG: 50S ribosomal protein L17 [Candidatus Omnitrophota bacterium]